MSIKQRIEKLEAGSRHERQPQYVWMPEDLARKPEDEGMRILRQANDIPDDVEVVAIGWIYD